MAGKHSSGGKTKTKPAVVSPEVVKPTKGKQQTRTEYNVSAEQFIKAWQAGNSAEEVSEVLGMPTPIVHARASTYRKAGVKLKSMPRKHRRGLDVNALNLLIEEEAQPAEAVTKKTTQTPKDVQDAMEKLANFFGGKKQ